MFARLSAYWRQDRPHYITLMSLILLGIGLRLAYITRGMRSDEADTFIQFASAPLDEALTSYTIPNNHLLNTFFIHLVYHALGNEPWVVRLPALLAGIVVLPAVYLVARRLYDRHVALLTLGLTATSAAMIEFSVNARGYSLLALATLALLGLAHQLQRAPRLALWAAFAVVAALGFYTVPTMLYPMGLVGLYLMIGIGVHQAGAARWRVWGQAVGALAAGAALTVLLYIPVIVVSGWDSLTGNQFVQPHSWSGFLWRFEAWPVAFQDFVMWQFPQPLIWLMWAAFWMGLIAHRGLAGDWVLWPLLGAAWTVVLVIIHRNIPPTRTWTAYAPLFYMVVAAGAVYVLRSWPTLPHIRRRRLRLASLGSAVVLALIIISANTVNESEQTGKAALAEDAALLLRDHYLQPGDRILAPLRTGAPLQYYLDYHQAPRVYDMRTEWDDDPFFIADIQRFDGDIYVFAEPYDTVDDLFKIFFNLQRPTTPVRLELLHDFGSNRLYRLSIAPAGYEIARQGAVSSGATMVVRGVTSSTEPSG
ncbi:MAG: glycosyltransferase family 39 protein [Anaerolineales bacterium]